MKIYTRGGDQGQTGLIGGPRVDKDHPRVRAYGELDELNAAIGLALSFLQGAAYDEARGMLGRIQADLFELGAELADPKGWQRVKPARVAELEAEIDAMTARSPALKTFILPGGSSAGAACHLARCICRRAEREVVALAKEAKVDTDAIRYLNRLSDHLFTLARELNRLAAVPEVPWNPRNSGT